MRGLARTLVSLITLTVLSGELSAADGPIGLDINDASILFPIDGSKKPVPFLGLDDPSLLSNDIFRAVLARATELGIKAPQTSSILNPADWNIVGFRYDPCAPEDHGISPSNGRTDARKPRAAAAGCLTELRLIAQPRARFSPADSSLHLIYKLKAGQPLASDPILLDLVQLKRDTEALAGLSTAGSPLGVHPALALAVKDKRSDIPALYSAFLKKHATVDRLSKVTMMGLAQGVPTDWIFFGGDVDAGRWHNTAIPNLVESSNTAMELIIQGPSKNFKAQPTKSELSLASFFNSSDVEVHSQLTSLDHTIHTLENPRLSNRNTVDCISCHTSTTVRLSGDFPFASLVQGLTAPIPTGITAFPAPASLPSHPLHWNLRAFGYFGLVPTVSMRTVHEAASAVETINTLLNLPAPGPDCSAEIEAVMSCFVGSSGVFATTASSEDCLSTCQKQ